MKAYPPSAMVQYNSISPIQNLDDYRRIYAQSKNDHNSFWLGQSKDLVHWSKPPTIGLEGDFRSVEQKPFTWFSDGELNITESCLDRHLDKHGEKVAILWEGDNPEDIEKITYRALP